jgi:hypothetical protein
MHFAADSQWLPDRTIHTNSPRAIFGNSFCHQHLVLQSLVNVGDGPTDARFIVGFKIGVEPDNAHTIWGEEVLLVADGEVNPVNPKRTSWVKIFRHVVSFRVVLSNMNIISRGYAICNS